MADSTSSSQPLTAAAGHSDSIRRSAPTGDMSGLKRKVVRQRRPAENVAYALRTRVPELPSIANDRHHQLPAYMKLAPVPGSRATHGDTLVMRRSSVRFRSAALYIRRSETCFFWRPTGRDPGSWHKRPVPRTSYIATYHPPTMVTRSDLFRIGGPSGRHGRPRMTAADRLHPAPGSTANGRARRLTPRTTEDGGRRGPITESNLSLDGSNRPQVLAAPGT